MRKILYSPGYGAGWVSWHYGSREERLFMLEYKPFIEALEAGQEISDKLIEQFEKEFKEKFPNADLPYNGGLGNLRIHECPDGIKVKIDEYDGYERVDEFELSDEWL